MPPDHPEPAGSWPEPAGHQLQPAGHQPQPASHQLQPAGSRPEPPGPQPQLAGHQPAETDVKRRFVVCGDNPMAYRLVHALLTQYDAQVTAVLPAKQQNWAPEICELPDVEVVEAERLDAAALTRAGIAEADALALVAQDDGGNVETALLAQELNPNLRVVIRMYNQELGQRMGELLTNSAVLSAAAIAAPAFVAAAQDEASAPILVADRALIAIGRERVHPDEIVCGLAITEGRDEAETLPSGEDEEDADLVLARTKPAASVKPRRPRRTLRLVPLIFSRRVRQVLAALLILFGAGTAALAWVKQVGWAQAAYIALITELGGADADPNASGVERVTLVVLTFVSIAVIPVLTVTVVDAAVQARLRVAAGGLIEKVADHTIVVGLGNLGIRVLRSLHDNGLNVVAIERNAQARGVQVARDLRIPVIIGDASRIETLRSALVDRCRALVIVSTDDVTNLETALAARSANPQVRVVVRLFDGAFADRAQRAFGINATRSESYLAAPAFAAAMLGRQIIATIPVQRRVLLVAELPVGAGSVLEHRSVASVNRPHEVRVIAVRTAPTSREPAGQVLWAGPRGEREERASASPAAANKRLDDRRLSRTDHLIVVATRAGLGRLVSDLTVANTDPARADRAEIAFQLLQPGQAPATGPAPSSGPAPATRTAPPDERTDLPRPIGPADDTPIRPA